MEEIVSFCLVLCVAWHTSVVRFAVCQMTYLCDMVTVKAAMFDMQFVVVIDAVCMFVTMFLSPSHLPHSLALLLRLILFGYV